MPFLDAQACDELFGPGASGRVHRLGLSVILVFQVTLSLWLGWPEPRASRWWDERFNVGNIESILKRGRLQPANAYYGGVSYLPQTLAVGFSQRLYGATGWEALHVLDAKGRLAPNGYHLCRAFQALFGALAVVLTYGLGRRLATPGVGLLAAALLAVSPRLLHAGAIFKPDVELLALSLLALYAGWSAAARPAHTGRYLLAGAAVGLATGAKLNGVTIAAPLVLATLIRWRQAERWPRLVLAAAAGFLTFWVFNPDLARVLRSLEKNRAHYERTATGGAFEVLREVVTYPFDASFHGPVIGTLGLVGMAALAAWCLRGRGKPGRRLGGWMLLSYPLVYYGVYILASPRAKPNHFLQMVPFGALFAALALVAAGRWLVSVDDRRGLARAVVALGAAAVVGVPAARSFGQVYDLTVPSTWVLAKRWVEASLPEPSRGRRVLVTGGVLQGARPRSPSYARLPESAEESRSALAQADAVIVEHQALDAGPVATTLPRWSGSESEPMVFRPGWFSARGEAVAAFLRPRRFAPHPANGRMMFTAGPGGSLRGVLPSDLPPDRELSVRVRLRLDRSAAPHLRLIVAGASHEWIAGPASAGDTFFTSARFPVPEGSRLGIVLEGGTLQSQAKAELFVWFAS